MIMDHLRPNDNNNMNHSPIEVRPVHDDGEARVAARLNDDEPQESLYESLLRFHWEQNGGGPGDPKTMLRGPDPVVAPRTSAAKPGKYALSRRVAGTTHGVSSSSGSSDYRQQQKTAIARLKSGGSDDDEDKKPAAIPKLHNQRQPLRKKYTDMVAAAQSAAIEADRRPPAAAANQRPGGEGGSAHRRRRSTGDFDDRMWELPSQEAPRVASKPSRPSGRRRTDDGDDGLSQISGGAMSRQSSFYKSLMEAVERESPGVNRSGPLVAAAARQPREEDADEMLARRLAEELATDEKDMEQARRDEELAREIERQLQLEEEQKAKKDAELAKQLMEAESGRQARTEEEDARLALELSRQQMMETQQQAVPEQMQILEQIRRENERRERELLAGRDATRRPGAENMEDYLISQQLAMQEWAGYQNDAPSSVGATRPAPHGQLRSAVTWVASHPPVHPLQQQEQTRRHPSSPPSHSQPQQGLPLTRGTSVRSLNPADDHLSQSQPHTRVPTTTPGRRRNARTAPRHGTRHVLDQPVHPLPAPTTFPDHPSQVTTASMVHPDHRQPQVPQVITPTQRAHSMQRGDRNQHPIRMISFTERSIASVPTRSTLTDSNGAPSQLLAVSSAQPSEELLRRGNQETWEAMNSGESHVVECQGCGARLHAPLSYSLVFCPNCRTVSPGQTAARAPASSAAATASSTNSATIGRRPNRSSSLTPGRRRPRGGRR